jgi:hypothetical protein
MALQVPLDQQEQQVRQDQPGPLAPMARMETQAQLGRQDPPGPWARQAQRVPLEQQERMVQTERMETQARRAQQARQELMAPMEPTVTQGRQDPRVQRALQDQQGPTQPFLDQHRPWGYWRNRSYGTNRPDRGRRWLDKLDWHVGLRNVIRCSCVRCSGIRRIVVCRNC